MKKLKDVKGKRVDGSDSSKDNPENYFTCALCGDKLYMGNLGDVFYHELPGHKSKENRA